jgi:hypothetical protein
MSHDFEKRAREILEESTGRLDGRTLSRITQARHAALDPARQPVLRRWSFLVPAGAAAAAAVLAVVLWPGPKGDPASPVDDIEMLADADAPDFAEGEDLEFYEWAAGEIET